MTHFIAKVPHMSEAFHHQVNQIKLSPSSDSFFVPKDVCNLIIGKLSCLHQLTCRLVCRSWNEMACRWISARFETDFDVLLERISKKQIQNLSLHWLKPRRAQQMRYHLFMKRAQPLIRDDSSLMANFHYIKDYNAFVRSAEGSLAESLERFLQGSYLISTCRGFSETY
eukprot:TRINITY_DN5932_c0_g1_i3.p1 TRINITY_DN5932_c0_g1~~TRINITY_DN5932_c0_g1_i3.p1  ORF type:complete len:169 (-),score=17.14 TRINITY_DN5932_c0_g1_i3:32-538(-)